MPQHTLTVEIPGVGTFEVPASTPPAEIQRLAREFARRRRLPPDTPLQAPVGTLPDLSTILPVVPVVAGVAGLGPLGMAGVGAGAEALRQRAAGEPFSLTRIAGAGAAEAGFTKAASLAGRGLGYLSRRLGEATLNISQRNRKEFPNIVDVFLREGIPVGQSQKAIDLRKQLKTAQAAVEARVPGRIDPLSVRADAVAGLERDVWADPEELLAAINEIDRLVTAEAKKYGTFSVPKARAVVKQLQRKAKPAYAARLADQAAPAKAEAARALEAAYRQQILDRHAAAGTLPEVTQLTQRLKEGIGLARVLEASQGVVMTRLPTLLILAGLLRSVVTGDPTAAVGGSVVGLMALDPRNVSRLAFGLHRLSRLPGATITRTGVALGGESVGQIGANIAQNLVAELARMPAEQQQLIIDAIDLLPSEDREEILRALRPD